MPSKNEEIKELKMRLEDLTEEYNILKETYEELKEEHDSLVNDLFDIYSRYVK